jgi:hypothetical protein
MGIYTFRPHGVGERSLTMRFANLPSDLSARLHAQQVLALYPDVDAVQIWEGERLVDSIARLVALDDCVA